MLRFVFSRQRTLGESGAVNVTRSAIDVEIPEIQNALESGGEGPMGFDCVSLIGVEILPTER